MKYDFHVHDAIRVEYRIVTDGPSFPRGYAHIENEMRVAGGNGVVTACALARWGAQVRLTGNPLGDDSHGQFLQRELGQIPNLHFEARVQASYETPYAILLRAGTHGVGTLLSATASRLELPRCQQRPHTAAFFFGDPAGFGEEGTTAILRSSSQDYEAILASLEVVSVCYLSLLENISPREKAAFTRYILEKYGAEFGGPQTIPLLEEIEASMGI